MTEKPPPQQDEPQHGPNGEQAEHPRRHRTRAEERAEALELPARSELMSRVDQLESELVAAQQDAGELRAAWQRTAADFANYKRRTEQEREAVMGLANELLLLKLLNVVDDFDRALAAMPRELEHLGWIEGIWLLERKLRALLESEGVTAMEVVGQPFDPREHEAVIHEDTTEAPDGTVIAELQRGYRLRDRVLRPALVKVANNSGQEAAPGGND